MSKKTWIIFIVVCVVVLGGLVAYSRKNQINVDAINQNSIVAASIDNGNIGDHVFGSKDGKTILIEYGDFQCPGCGAAYPTLKNVTEKNKDTLTFIFRNNPLTTIHPNARAAAAAAEAAGLQGKYWEMHDLLYEKQNDWSGASTDQRLSFFNKYASQVGVKDLKKFATDMESKAVTSKIDFDLSLGKKVQVDATPTIILNGKKIESDIWSNKEKFQAAIDNALK